MAKSRFVLIESLESRQLLSDWGTTAQLVHQDQAVANFPNVTGKGVTIAMIDTGVDYNHPALGGGFGPGHKVKAGWDFVDNDGDPFDTYGHGTNTAGIAAATGFDYAGAHYQGIAPDADIVELRIAKDGGGIQDQTLDDALKWVEQNYKTYGISVANISFGAGQYQTAYTNPTLSGDFQQLADDGILVVASSGNLGVSGIGGLGVAYPAADANVAAAGGVDASGNITTQTERGPLLDMLAPGDQVPTVTKFNGTGAATGTSFAAPFITGAAALLKQVDPTLKPEDILSILRASGTPKADTTTSFGVATTNTYPILNINAAIALAEARVAKNDPLMGKAGIVSDLAFDRNGVLHLAYYDSAAHTLKYASRSTDGNWSAVQTIEQGSRKKDDVGAFLSIAIDPTGKPAIAYYDATTADLKYAHFDGTKWMSQKLDTSKNTGLYPSLAFDSNGKAYIAYYRRTSGDLRLMTFDGTTWTRTTVDSAGDVGRSPSIAFNKSNEPAIAYADVKGGDLKYASFDGTSWTKTKVDNLKGVSDISLAFDTGDQPAIAYYNASGGDLKFAQDTGGTWSSETVARSGVQGFYASLSFDNLDTANIVYYNASKDKMMRVTGSMGSWAVSTLATRGGRFSSAAFQTDGGGSYAFWATKSKKLLVRNFS